MKVPSGKHIGHHTERMFKMQKEGTVSDILKYEGALKSLFRNTNAPMTSILARFDAEINFSFNFALTSLVGISCCYVQTRARD